MPHAAAVGLAGSIALGSLLGFTDPYDSSLEWVITLICGVLFTGYGLLGLSRHLVQELRRRAV